MNSIDKNKEVADTIMTAVNCFFDECKAVEHMTREHRTLQQTFTRVCVRWLIALSKQEHFDDRNAASVKLAKDFMSIPEVKDLLENVSLPLI